MNVSHQLKLWNIFPCIDLFAFSSNKDEPLMNCGGGDPNPNKEIRIKMTDYESVFTIFSDDGGHP